MLASTRVASCQPILLSEKQPILLLCFQIESTQNRGAPDWKTVETEMMCINLLILLAHQQSPILSLAELDTIINALQPNPTQGERIALGF